MYNLEMIIPLKPTRLQLVLEFKPQRRSWVILPAIILFLRGSESKEYTDLTFAWFCNGISLRLPK